MKIRMMFAYSTVRKCITTRSMKASEALNYYRTLLLFVQNDELIQIVDDMTGNVYAECYRDVHGVRHYCGNVTPIIK